MTVFVTLDTYILGWRPSDMDNGYNSFLRADNIGVELGFANPVFQKRFKEKYGKSIEEDKGAAAAEWTRTVFQGSVMVGMGLLFSRASRRWKMH